MRTRLIASAVVFVLGFGVGLGVTYALLAERPAPGREPGAEPVPVEGDPTDMPDESGAEPAASVAEREVAPKGGEPGDAPGPAKPADEVGRAPEVEAPADSEPGDAAAPAQPPEGAGVDEAVEPEGSPGQEPAPGASKTHEDDKKWWVGLAGKKCRVDLGRARALTIRTGELADGAVISWNEQFGKSPRIGLLYQGEDNVVTVHAVAVDSAGMPAAARITLDKQGRQTTGIIALHTQGLKVTLYPVDDSAATP